ncbi:hypothetical protein DPX16_2576 [Anabarilius grahami]|uniref:Uncharacterized protein n=1 Tax=Anabarilius grahami TaxID=495550 RepID=A0A3N0Y4E5_ANAGA|nr:hypothetical protein DPX16_2576 [Anabarilius grahami]
MDPNSASAGAPKSGKDKEKKSKKNYEEGDGKKKFRDTTVQCLCLMMSYSLPLPKPASYAYRSSPEIISTQCDTLRHNLDFISVWRLKRSSYSSKVQMLAIAVFAQQEVFGVTLSYQNTKNNQTLSKMKDTFNSSKPFSKVWGQ